MLTKALLRFSRNRQGQIFPRFLNADDKITQNLVEELSNLYQVGSEQSREELAELAQPVINAHRSPVIAKGINKLLLARCEFKEPDSEVEPFRTQVYAAATEILTSDDPKMDSLSHFRASIGKIFARDADELAAALYGDLPIRQPLQSFKPIPAQQLIHRYNLGQAQGLLFLSSEVNLTFNEPDVGRRRFFFRYLKYFRLRTQIYKEGQGKYRLEMTGPMNLLDQARTYGKRMGNLLPVVCLLAKWSLVAKVKPEQRASTLELDQNSGLQSHYSVTTSYVPEEFKIFATQFKSEAKGWKLQKISPLLDLGKHEIAVPDFSFRHESGIVVHLELFHRWHKGPLLQRLKHLSLLKATIPLVIGVDRFLTKDASTNSQLERSSWFQNHGLPFNSFPPVKRVVKSLESFLE